MSSQTPWKVDDVGDDPKSAPADQASRERWDPLYEAAMAGMSGEGGSFADPNSTAGDVASRALTHAGILGGAGGAAALGAVRLGGAAQGGTLGYRKGGIPGAVAGTVLGGIFPGTTTAVDVGEMAGGDVGGAAGLGAALIAQRFGIPASAVPALLKKAYDLMRGGGAAAKDAATIAKEVEAASAAARATKAIPRSVEAARAAREAKAAEALARANEIRGAAPTSAADLAPEMQQMLLKAQQLMKTTEGRATIKQWLKTQPPEIQAQIKPLLERGIAQPATTASGRATSFGSGPRIPADYGSELAKLLGQ